MPKVERVGGGAHDLRITRRKKRERTPLSSVGARIRVKCGCCNEAVDIHHNEEAANPTSNTLEINGVIGTLAQWRQVFAPLLGFQEVRTSERGNTKVTWESRV